MGVLFLMSNFRLYPGLKMSLEHDSVRKNLFLCACFYCDSRLSLSEMDQFFKFGRTLVMETRTWTLYFATPKCSDYMQYYTMLLEQFD